MVQSYERCRPVEADNRGINQHIRAHCGVVWMFDDCFPRDAFGGSRPVAVKRAIQFVARDPTFDLALPVRHATSMATVSNSIVAVSARHPPCVFG